MHVWDSTCHLSIGGEAIYFLYCGAYEQSHSQDTEIARAQGFHAAKGST